MSARAEQPAAGFATLEMLVAFLVLTLALTTMVETILVAGRNIDRAQADAAAVAAMQSFLAEDLARVVSQAGGVAYRAQGPSWRVEVDPVQGAPVVAVRLLVTNEKDANRPFRFLTFRPSPKAEQP